MEPRNQKLVYFDLETGGLDPYRHPIIQLAALAVDAAFEPLEAFEVKVRFAERQATKQSLRKNHYHRGIWARDALDSHEAAKRFAAFLTRHATYTSMSSSGKPFHLAQLVAHNATFDGPFLQAWYERLKMFLPARFQVLCTLQRAQWYFAEHPTLALPTNFKLAALCEHFRVPFHAASAHEALGDVTATFLLYRAIKLASENARGNREFADTNVILIK